MKKNLLKAISAAAALCCTAMASFSDPISLTVENVSELESKFRSDPVWSGADGAVSIPLSKERTLWLFGDTWIKNGAEGKVMIRNSAAVQQLERQDCSFKFFWRADAKTPADLLRPANKKEWYWPGVGIKYDGKLFLVMKRIRSTDSGPEEFRFDWHADDLVVIDNPDDNPDRWRLSRHALPEKNGKILFGVAATADSEFFYVYCSVPAKKTSMHPHPLAVARIALSSLSRNRMQDWQFYCRSEESSPDWKNSADDPLILFPDAAPEMSVDITRDGVIALYQPPLSPTIMMRRASSPTGPFSTARALYKCPESEIVSAGSRTLVYAAKAHPELSRRDDELIVTYCVNPGPLSAHLERPDLYFPRVLKIRAEF